jgi:outer membrane receptor protein involved in Fe transport
VQYPDPLHSELAIFANRQRGYPSTWWPVSGRPWLKPAEKPERMQAWELQSIHYIGKGRLSMDVFYQKINDVIAWYYSWTNMGDLEGWGAEFDFQYPVADWCNVWVNGAYHDTRIDLRSPMYTGIRYADPSEHVVGVPSFQANAGCDVAVTDDITVTGTLRWMTEIPLMRQRFGTARGEYWDVQRNHNLYLDLTFLWENFLLENLDLRLAGKNVLNNRSYVPRQREKGDMTDEGAYAEATLSYSW